MIEALFKKKILVILLFNIVFLQSGYNNEFVFNNSIPLELSQASFGVKILDYNNNSKISFNYQTWITDNLTLDGYYSPSFNNRIDITYGINVGYASNYNKTQFKNINYSIGYFNKRFSNDMIRWSNISIIPVFTINNQNWYSVEFNYSYSNQNDNKINRKSLIYKYMKSFKDKYILNLGIQIDDYNNDNLIYPFFGLNYVL